MKKAIIICGPTASGKTDLAHALAIKRGGEIVNADSMQLYKQLPIITASPSDELKAELPYHLYNFLDVDQEFSAAKYVQVASNVIAEIDVRGNLPIIVGGSGMYISMLVNGYSAIPDINEGVRKNARELHAKIGAQEFFKQLELIDPAVASTLKPLDTQRTVRAYEVFKQTGESILSFQAKDNIKLLPEFEFEILFLLPERKFLYDTCNKRLVKLFESGAIEEVKRVYTEYGDLNTTAMKALAVSEIISYIKGEITLADAIELASAKTRQYAKRQCTWFRNQLSDKQTIEFGSVEEYFRVVESGVTGTLL